MIGTLAIKHGAEEIIGELPPPLLISGKGKGHNFVNMTDTIINDIKILYPVEKSKDGHIKYLMQCYCGRYFITMPKHIKSGNTKSCGCRKIQSVINRNHEKTTQLIGQTYGALEILEFSHYEFNSQNTRDAIYKCRCLNCNSICYKKGYEIKAGMVVSCGCLHSYQEFRIKQLLEEANIKYSQQQTFSDLISPLSNYKLRFDFAIYRDDNLLCLIEYQGEQHYNQNNPWYSSTAQIRDQAKREYCRNNNIVLLEINKNHNLDKLIEILKRGEIPQLDQLT